MLRACILFLLSPALWAQQTPVPSAADLVKQGQKLNSEGKQDEALALYRQAIETSPNLYESASGFRHRARLERQLRRSSRAFFEGA